MSDWRDESIIETIIWGDEIDGAELIVHDRQKTSEKCSYLPSIKIINRDSYGEIEAVYSFSEKEELEKLRDAIEFLIQNWNIK